MAPITKNSVEEDASNIRYLKTQQIRKLVEKLEISDRELWVAATELEAGKGDNLGGNAWKERLDENRKRGIVVNKVGEYWIFVFVFEKNVIANIPPKVLKGFKKLAKDYGKLKPAGISKLIDTGELLEIKNVCEKIRE